MTVKILLCSFTLFFVAFAAKTTNSPQPAKKYNREPIIGILSQEVSTSKNRQYSTEYKSYIAASYVKFVESAGARVVPIWIGQNYSYYEDLMSKINGVLLPGGAASFNRSKGYAEAGGIIYEIAKRFNDNKSHFPIFGLCLGFELLTYLAANRVDHRSPCSAYRLALPLEFTKDINKSRMFAHTRNSKIQIMRSKNVSYNSHGYCVTKSDLERVNITSNIRILSLNKDRRKLEFISSFEDIKYPFYGVQFHPEKNLFEWIDGKNIPHGYNAAVFSQYFANFFMNEARKNMHHFEKNELREKLIYNYAAEFSGRMNSSFVQRYMFIL